MHGFFVCLYKMVLLVDMWVFVCVWRGQCLRKADTKNKIKRTGKLRSIDIKNASSMNYWLIPETEIINIFLRIFLNLITSENK